ncbi:DUF2809 domain-containing protein [Pendulispora rubella]|uniref:DUF2809 domain-containing protein n=1 Tax=Pendulispora rubella TaxID=2741070 RepID=UPI00374DFC59
MPCSGPSRLAAIAAAFLVLFVGLAVRKWTGGAIALGFCWAIEFGQLSSIPASLAKRSMLARLVLGTTFNTPLVPLRVSAPAEATSARLRGPITCSLQPFLTLCAAPTAKRAYFSHKSKKTRV